MQNKDKPDRIVLLHCHANRKMITISFSETLVLPNGAIWNVHVVFFLLDVSLSELAHQTAVSCLCHGVLFLHLSVCLSVGYGTWRFVCIIFPCNTQCISACHQREVCLTV